MKNKHFYVLAIMAAAVVTTVFVANFSLAQQGDYQAGERQMKSNNSQMRQNYDADRHLSMVQIMENKDFSAWQELMAGKGRALDMVTEDNFNQFVQAWELMQAGEYEQARELRTELGLGGGRGHKGPRGQAHSGCQGGCQGDQQMNFVDSNGDGVCDNR